MARVAAEAVGCAARRVAVTTAIAEDADESQRPLRKHATSRGRDRRELGSRVLHTEYARVAKAVTTAIAEDADESQRPPRNTRREETAIGVSWDPASCTPRRPRREGCHDGNRGGRRRIAETAEKHTSRAAIGVSWGSGVLHTEYGRVAKAVTTAIAENADESRRPRRRASGRPSCRAFRAVTGGGISETNRLTNPAACL